jgi:CHASE2 domain-containing sensor protein
MKKIIIIALCAIGFLGIGYSLSLTAALWFLGLAIFITLGIFGFTVYQLSKQFDEESNGEKHNEHL